MHAGVETASAGVFEDLAETLLGFLSVFLFRGQIRGLMNRLKKGKLFGQEIELEASLNELNARAMAVASEVSEMPSLGNSPAVKIESADAVDDIFKIAATSPKAALVTLSAVIEREGRDSLAATGWAKGLTSHGLSETVAHISAVTGLPQHVTGSLKQFSEVRNRIVHGGSVATDDDVLRALDSGITILKALQAIPRETNVVWNAEVPVYSDAELKSPIQGVKGVILKTTSPGGAQTSLRIFPTTKSWFEKDRGFHGSGALTINGGTHGSGTRRRRKSRLLGLDLLNLQEDH